MAAHRIADLAGEPVGETVGYRVRHDSRVGPNTRIEVVTDGLFLRRLQADPGLADVACVVFDEVHERHLGADLALALCLDARQLRDDLRLVVMSATLDGAPFARLLDDAPVIESVGRSFPVETRYLPDTAAGRGQGDRLAGLVRQVIAAVRRALDEEIGDLLVFLPGVGDIRRVEAVLTPLIEATPTPPAIVPLYGDLDAAAQDRAVRPRPDGRRRVVLATAVAESSLTIEGVRVVIDCGWMRVPRFDPATGMSSLATVRVSRASADQRRGRAGRTAPGVCYRLWPEPETKALPAFGEPEIVQADLMPLALELAAWGVRDADALAWLTPPPPGPLAGARERLVELAAIDDAGRLTDHGRAIAALGAHPRLAHMILCGARAGRPGLACALAALVGDRDVLTGVNDADLRSRVALIGPNAGGQGGDRDQRPDTVNQHRNIDRKRLHEARATAQTYQRMLNDGARRPRGAITTGLDAVGWLVAHAYPERVARRRGVEGGLVTYQLVNGRLATLDGAEPLAAHDWLAVATLVGSARRSRITHAAALTRDEVETLFADRIVERAEIAWDPRARQVQVRTTRRLGALILDDRPIRSPDPDAVADALIAGLRQEGVAVLPWAPATRSLRARVAFVRAHHGAATGWPDLSDKALGATLDDWLKPFVGGIARLNRITPETLHAAVTALIPPPLLRRLDRLAPTHWMSAGGVRRRLDYEATGAATATDSGDPAAGAPPAPVLRVRVHDLFGTTETPRVVDGTVPVVLHLLSPADRPVQVTRDLAGFWAGAYYDVRRDLRGRYPKHPWPDDPKTVEPPRRRGPRA